MATFYFMEQISYATLVYTFVKVCPLSFKKFSAISAMLEVGSQVEGGVISIMRSVHAGGCRSWDCCVTTWRYK